MHYQKVEENNKIKVNTNEVGICSDFILAIFSKNFIKSIDKTIQNRVKYISAYIEENGGCGVAG